MNTTLKLCVWFKNLILCQPGDTFDFMPNKKNVGPIKWTVYGKIFFFIDSVLISSLLYVWKI